MRDPMTFRWLDGVQLVKHAFGLRSAVHRKGAHFGKRPVLVYLYAEPRSWPGRQPIPDADLDAHRAEVSRFAEAGAGDEVAFRACTYSEMLRTWEDSEDEPAKSHADAVAAEFDVSRDFRASKKD